MHCTVPAALFTRAKTWEQTKCPSEKWIKMPHTPTMEYYAVMKRDEIVSFAETRLELKIVIQREEKHIIY